MKIHYSVLICLLVIGCRQPDNNNSFDIVEANRTGIKILSGALKKHGDFYSDSMEISFEIICANYFHPTQSQVPFHPMTAGFSNRAIWVSPKSGEEIFNTKLKAGSYIFHDVIVLQNDRRISYNVNTKTFEENNFEFTRNLPLIPQTYLRKALENQAGIKAISILDETNKSAFLVESFFDGSQHKLWLDQDTVLVRIESLRYSSTYGQSLRSFSFNGNRRIKGYLLPSEIIENYKNNAWDEVKNIYNLNNVKKEKVTSFLEETSSYKLGDHSYRKIAEVVKLADNIYVIENVTSSSRFWSYNVLFAEFEDYVLVVEAPVNNDISTLVMKKVKETIPNKPIKYIVQSHHHSDHLAGIKKYIEEGITIITSSATSKVIERISEAFHYNNNKESISPQFHIVDQKFELNDNLQSASIIDIGPTLHSKEMIVIYFPNQRILFQADMLNYGEWPIDTDNSVEFVQKIKNLNLPIDMIVGLHGKIITKDNVKLLFKGKLENKFVND